jgi:hypothetical protein
MGSALDSYVDQRIPTVVIDELLRVGSSVEVHGIYPTHVPRIVDNLRLLHPGRAFPGKSYNVLRPRLFIGAGGRLVMAVPPGHDYVLHYASLLRHHLRTGGYPDELLRVERYPHVAEAGIATWTALADLVRPGDRLLMGYVNEVGSRLAHAGGHVTEKTERRYYGLTRIRFPNGEVVSLLGVRFSFWGCISARLAAACQRLGAAEIVYVGKLGTLATPSDIYQRVFLPTGYLDFNSPGGVLAGDDAPPNGLLATYPQLATGTHMSVSTVLEEDVHQRAYADAHNVQSIDNEIAKMAHALARSVDGHRTAFAALHFATDYLRRPAEREFRHIHNLTNHRDADALRGKSRMLDHIARLLAAHYDNGPLDLQRAADAPVPAALSDTTMG